MYRAWVKYVDLFLFNGWSIPSAVAGNSDSIDLVQEQRDLLRLLDEACTLRQDPDAEGQQQRHAIIGPAGTG